MPEFYIIIARKIFFPIFWRGHVSPAPPSPTPMLNTSPVSPAPMKPTHYSPRFYSFWTRKRVHKRDHNGHEHSGVWRHIARIKIHRNALLKCHTYDITLLTDRRVYFTDHKRAFTGSFIRFCTTDAQCMSGKLVISLRVMLSQETARCRCKFRSIRSLQIAIVLFYRTAILNFNHVTIRFAIRNFLLVVHWN